MPVEVPPDLRPGPLRRILTLLVPIAVIAGVGWWLSRQDSESSGLLVMGVMVIFLAAVWLAWKMR